LGQKKQRQGIFNELTRNPTTNGPLFLPIFQKSPLALPFQRWRVEGYTGRQQEKEGRGKKNTIMT
jgi:hypothetical protein